MPVVSARWWLRWTAPLTWRGAAGRARRLFLFSLAEHNSYIELVQAANATPDPARAAAYLRHADDEARHTRMFHNRARQLDDATPARVRADSSDLFTALGEPGFVAFVHHGEGQAVSQFETLRAVCASLQDDKTAAVFDAILDDEREHQRYSGALLPALEGVAGGGHAVREARWWSLTSAWRRFHGGVASGLFQGLMVGVYLLLWPLAWWTRRVRPASDQFVSPT